MISAVNAIGAAAVPELAASTPAAVAPQAGDSSFTAVLSSLVSQAGETLRQGEAAAIAGMQGTMPIQQVVDHVLEAERTLQTTIAIRDKLVGAFLEISRMQI